MKLKLFRVENFRSINDSGDIDVADITALLGRNESGKSNLLIGLRSLNPAEGFTALNPIKDFPRDRRLEECGDYTRVVSTEWELNDEDKAELLEILPRATNVSRVRIGRYYKANRWVAFPDLEAQAFDPAQIKSTIKKIVPAVKAAAAKLEAGPQAKLEASADTFEAATALQSDRTSWAQTTKSALAALRQALAAADTELTERQDQLVTELEELSDNLAGDATAQQEARDWAVSKLPKFVFLDEYPDLQGHQNITYYLQRKSNGTLTDADRNFEKLCKVAGLDAQKLQELLGAKEQETRNQLANRASAVVTSEIRRLWKDRQLKIRFNLDAEHTDTFVSDPNAIYDVEVNLDERSRGFKWFFSFYITFAADTKDDSASGAILLLDEPGLYLHARSQSDLLNHFKKDFDNQILYTTHSPFMVPTHALETIRTVSITEDKGTTVTNDPTGDARTLFPIQAALGYDLAQSLFIGPNNLVVEGVTDYWILSSVSAYLAELGQPSLDEKLTLTPAGGAQKVSYMVALLTSEQLNVLVLMDEEKDARSTKDDLVRSKLIRDQNVVFVSESYSTTKPSEADIEDLLDPAVYEGLVRDSYAKELKSKKLTLNANIPRIAKRVEKALEDIGIPFHKTRPTRLLLAKMASDPASIVTTEAGERFSRLFGLINERLAKHVARDGQPFS